jgi:hypothetical protein
LLDLLGLRVAGDEAANKPSLDGGARPPLCELAVLELVL